MSDDSIRNHHDSNARQGISLLMGLRQETFAEGLRRAMEERAEFRREAERLKELLAAYESAEVVEVQYRTASHSVWMPRTFFRPTDESTAEYRELIVKPKRAQQPAGGAA